VRSGRRAQRAQRRVERGEAGAQLRVGTHQRGIGLDHRDRAHARGCGLVGVGEHAGRDAAEQRGTVGRAGIHERALEWHVEDRREDLEPELAARSTTGHARMGWCTAQLADELEAFTQAEGDPLEHRAHERAAIVAQAQPDEGAARVGVGMGGPLAGEIGREAQSLGTRLPGGGRRQQRVELGSA